MKRSVTTRSPEETLEVGESIGKEALPGLVVTLRGPLGAGKTVLAKGIAKGIGVPSWRYVTSPTFALHNIYRGVFRLHHLDLYRLSGPEEAEALGLEEHLGGPDVAVVEWPDGFFEELPEDRLEIHLHWEQGEGRRIDFVSRGPVSRAVLAKAVRPSTASKRRGGAPVT